MANSPITTYRYPLNLGTKAEVKKTLPYVQFRIAKYRERTLLQDFEKVGAVVTNIAEEYSIESGDAFMADMEADVMRDTIEDDWKEAKRIFEKSVGNVSADVEESHNIFLPLPQNLINSYVPMWEMQDMYLVNGALDVADAVASGNWMEAMGRAVGSISAATLNQNGGMFAQKFLALTPNPKKQAIFTGIEPRTFVFEYVFSAQTEEEAKVIEKIVKTFTKFALPSNNGTFDTFWHFPSEFQINFKNVEGFPIIEWCTCTGVSTNYSPGSMQLLKSGHAIQIGLVMTFQETSLRTQEKPGV